MFTFFSQGDVWIWHEFLILSWKREQGFVVYTANELCRFSSHNLNLNLPLSIDTRPIVLIYSPNLSMGGPVWIGHFNFLSITAYNIYAPDTKTLH